MIKTGGLTGGYKIVELSINDDIIQGNVIEFYTDGDKKITAVYDRFVSVVVHDGKGSGVYSYGDTIVISAPDKPIISYLVKETFNHWEGINKKSSSFVIPAEKDIEVTAVYRDDYTILMGVILSGVIGAVIFVIKNGDNALRYRAEEITEKILPIIKKYTPSFSLKKPKILTDKK